MGMLAGAIDALSAPRPAALTTEKTLRAAAPPHAPATRRRRARRRKAAAITTAVDPDAPLKGYLGKVVAAIATTVTFTGLVAVIGGTVLYVRFFTSGMPADQAVAAVPKAHLIVFGASALIGFVILGLAAVALVYVLDAELETHLVSAGLGAVMGAEMTYTLWDLPLGSVDLGIFGTPDPNRLKAEVTLLIWVLVVAGLIALGNWAATTATDDKRSAFADGYLRGIIVVEIAGTLLVFFLDDTLAIVWLVIMVVGTVVLKVADVSLHRFWPFATALLVSVPIVGGVYLAIKAAKHPVAQPIAILLKDGSTQDGLFVAESDTRVWAGKASGRNGDGYLFWVDRKLVRTYAIGPVQEQDHALLRAQELVSELDRFKPGVKDTPAATESVVCTITHGKRRRISEKRSFTRPVASKPACG